MAVREWVFAFVLLVACGLVVGGLALLHPAAALIAAGVLLAGWAWLIFGDIARREE